MKSYKKATLVAKNARTGSYAAGCPTYGTFFDASPEANGRHCKDCERSE